jgi:hypothetical protein
VQCPIEIRGVEEIVMRIIATIVFGSVTILAASSVSAQVIHACAKSNDGSLRVVSNPAECKAKESPLAWNVQGPTGPQGPAGAQGPAGPQGEPGPAKDIGEIVRIEIPATSGFDTTWFVPLGKALLVDHIGWSDAWLNSVDPMEVTLRHFINKVGASSQTVFTSTTGFRSFARPLVLPANTGFDAPDLGDDPTFPRAVFVYGRLVDADSALLSGSD